MRWLRRLFRKRALDNQLDSELHFHIEQQIADNLAAGMSQAKARRRALAQFGGVEYVKEECREAPGTHFVETLRIALGAGRPRVGGSVLAFALLLSLAAALAFGLAPALLATPSKFSDEYQGWRRAGRTAWRPARAECPCDD
jgi:hypothetical protein